MSSVSPSRLVHAWPLAVPVLAVALLAATWGRHPGPVLVAVVALVLLIGTFVTYLIVPQSP